LQHNIIFKHLICLFFLQKEQASTKTGIVILQIKWTFYSFHCTEKSQTVGSVLIHILVLSENTFSNNLFLPFLYHFHSFISFHSFLIKQWTTLYLYLSVCGVQNTYSPLLKIHIRRCIQKSQDNAHNTQVPCSSRVSR